MFQKALFFLIISTFSFCVFAQEDKDKKKKEEQFLNYEEPDFLLEQDTLTKVEKKIKKRKKKTFNGLKTRRAFTRKGKGKREAIELFYFLKKYKEPDHFVSEIYLYEVLKLQIVSVKDYDKVKYPPNQYKILHGTYTKKQDTLTLVDGYFYIGTKHHRWEYYNNDILINKEVYHKGYSAESQLSYYDAEKKKLKEVIPFEFGEKTGRYVSYFLNGTVQETGMYQNGKKIGKWQEYFEYRHRNKKITQYPKDSFDETLPVVINEWDKEGKVLIGTTSGDKKGKLGKKQ